MKMDNDKCCDTTGKNGGTAAAKKTMEPAQLGAGVMAPSVAMEDKATFTEHSVGSKN